MENEQLNYGKKKPIAKLVDQRQNAGKKIMEITLPNLPLYLNKNVTKSTGPQNKIKLASEWN